MDWKDEYKKCQEDPHHFFTNYWMVDGKPGTTRMTKEQFNDFFKLGEVLFSGSKSELTFHNSN